MTDPGSLLENTRVVPVVVIEQVEQAEPLAQALVNAGIGAMEITLRTEAALAAIEIVAARLPDIIVGAGSVRTAGQFTEIVDAGARFAVSPGATDALLAAAEATAMPFVPGAATATEVLRLFESGYRLQKLFPAQQLGGIPLIKALGAPLPEVSFFPTGGIDLELAREYLALPNVHCVGGSWFVPADALRTGDFERITVLAREAAGLGAS